MAVQDTKKISDLEAVRLLSDPFKLRLIKAFAESERTAADVAKLLEEPVTKLYRHVDALLDAGLIEIASETPKRGTVERTFRTTARRFEVDQSLFSGGPDSESAKLVRDVLGEAEDEIVHALENQDAELEPVLVRMVIKGRPDEVSKLQQELIDWVERVSAESGELEEDMIEAGCLVAFYRKEDKA